MKLDEMTPYEIISIMNREDHNVIEAVHRALPDIETAILWATESLRHGGRIIYRSRNQRASGSVGCCRMSAYLWRTR